MTPYDDSGIDIDTPDDETPYPLPGVTGLAACKAACLGMRGCEGFEFHTDTQKCNRRAYIQLEKCTSRPDLKMDLYVLPPPEMPMTGLLTSEKCDAIMFNKVRSWRSNT